MKKMITLLVAVIAVAAAAFAQSPNPIKWRAFVSMSSEKEGVVTLKAIVEPGWHLYGTSLPADGPKPTSFDFSQSKGVKFIGAFTPSAKPVEKHDDMFGLTLSWWDSNVSFTRKFRLTGSKADALVKGTVSFMGCNDETCLPPKSQTFSLTVK